MKTIRPLHEPNHEPLLSANHLIAIIIGLLLLIAILLPAFITEPEIIFTNVVQTL